MICYAMLCYDIKWYVWIRNTHTHTHSHIHVCIYIRTYYTHTRTVIYTYPALSPTLSHRFSPLAARFSPRTCEVSCQSNCKKCRITFWCCSQTGLVFEHSFDWTVWTPLETHPWTRASPLWSQKKQLQYQLISWWWYFSILWSKRINQLSYVPHCESLGLRILLRMEQFCSKIRDTKGVVSVANLNAV